MIPYRISNWLGKKVIEVLQFSSVFNARLLDNFLSALQVNNAKRQYSNATSLYHFIVPKLEHISLFSILRYKFHTNTCYNSVVNYIFQHIFSVTCATTNSLSTIMANKFYFSFIFCNVYIYQ